MASRRTRKTKAKSTDFDIEAVGFVVLASGIFLLGLLLPQMPTGELGERARSVFTSRMGLGAYLLPWPLLGLGGLFMLRRNPKSWPRVLAGYFVAAAGVWCLVVLAEPSSSGSWGTSLRRLLTGATGLLAYLPALFLVSLGAELMLGWRPTRISRGVLRSSVNGVRHAFKSFMAARARWKEAAGFRADIALARRDLNELDKDLQALTIHCPGSAEVSSWNDSVRTSLKTLQDPTKQNLVHIQRDLKAWKKATQTFVKDRAKDFSTKLGTEGVNEFEHWVKGLKGQINDPAAGTGPVTQALETVRKALALDLTGVSERHRRLIRERDLAQASLRSIKPRDLPSLAEQHEKRQAQYQTIVNDTLAIEADADKLEPWREFAGKFSRLNSEFPVFDELREFGETLAKEMKAKGRLVLGELEGWQHALDGIELRAREGRVPAEVDLKEDWFEEVENTEDDFAFSPSEDLSEPPAPVEDDFVSTFDTSASSDEPEITSSVLPEDEYGPIDAGDIPVIGGIPIQVPTYDLLDPVERGFDDPAALAQEVQARVRKIDETLANFGLAGRVVASVRGPTVTRFEVEPAPGEKISRFANLSDDLALAMAVGSVRIEAPIPGKSVIGLEVPNANRDLIRFREAAEAGSYKRSKSRLPLILGKSIDGEMVVADLTRMPHLLIAGSTGAGKSVAVNTLIGSLLYKFLPTELRFLMIDPKMVELTPFDGIPHLLRPVVTNPNDAAGVLLGAVAHMERRYKMMSRIGAKNLDQYNEKARNLDLPEMPFIVLIIDELADLMITSPKEVESAIMRLAQMARATGMHLVLATQRPSVDILTSLIKVNVPARMAFAVSSGHDSRTILDSMGAERLIGMGDMLYYQPGMVKAARLQGPFISENELSTLSNFLRRQYFDDDFVEAYGTDFDPPSLHESDASGLIDWNDDKLREAAELIVNEGQASVSRLQRRLQVGHARAGKLMDSLEALGVVGPHAGSKPREVLVELHELPNFFGK